MGRRPSAGKLSFGFLGDYPISAWAMRSRAFSTMVAPSSGLMNLSQRLKGTSTMARLARIRPVGVM